MTLSQMKVRQLERRAASVQSIANLRAKLIPHERDGRKVDHSQDHALRVYVAREVAKHEAIIAAINADLEAAGLPAG